MKKRLKKRIIILSILGFLLCVSNIRAVEDVLSKPLVFTQVNVIDTARGTIQPKMTIIIKDKTIAQIGKADKVGIPKEAKVIDAVGKYMIPGLWDMHVHWYETDYLPLFIANGVTGIRLMFGAPQHFYWRKDIRIGKLVGPRMVIASRILDGSNPLWPGSIVVTNDQQARQTVRQAKYGGCDFIKVYNKLSREAYYSIADECRRLNIPFAGHVPHTISIREASAAGQKSIEHMRDIIRGCSNQENTLQQELQKDPRSKDRVMEKALDSFDRDKATSLCKAFIKHDTWLCPTLNYHRHYYLCHDKSIYTDPRLEYMPQFLRNEWQSKHNKRLALYTEKYQSSAEKIFQGCLKTMRSVKDAGLGPRILVGTDTGNPYCMPGFSLHDELKFLVQSGFTPAEALRASTYNAARFLGKKDSMGTIEEGKLADLVLLEANPLEDIQNTTRIAAVMFDGKLYPKSEIQKMLAEIKAIASKIPIQDVLIKTIREKDVAAAIKQFHKLKAEHPDDYNFTGLNALGFQLLRMNRAGDAIEIFKLSNEVQPFFYTYYGLAKAYQAHGDVNLAIENCKQALKLKPDFKEAAELLKALQKQ